MYYRIYLRKIPCITEFFAENSMHYNFLRETSCIAEFYGKCHALLNFTGNVMHYRFFYGKCHTLQNFLREISHIKECMYGNYNNRIVYVCGVSYIIDSGAKCVRCKVGQIWKVGLPLSKEWSAYRQVAYVGRTALQRYSYSPITKQSGQYGTTSTYAYVFSNIHSLE